MKMMHENNAVRPSTTCPTCEKVGKLPQGVQGWPKSVRCKKCGTDFDPRSVKPDVFEWAPEPPALMEHDIVEILNQENAVASQQPAPSQARPSAAQRSNPANGHWTSLERDPSIQWPTFDEVRDNTTPEDTGVADSRIRLYLSKVSFSSYRLVFSLILAGVSSLILGLVFFYFKDDVFSALQNNPESPVAQAPRIIR
jgi:hypothetical protein